MAKKKIKAVAKDREIIVLDKRFNITIQKETEEEKNEEKKEEE